MGLFDWINDLSGSNPLGGPVGGDSNAPAIAATNAYQGTPPVNPSELIRASQPAPPVQMTGADAPLPPGSDPMAAGGSPPNGPGLPYATGGDPMTAGLPPPNGALPQGGDPMTAGGSPANGPGLPPPVDVGASSRPPITMNEPPPNAGPPMPLGPGLGVGAPPPNTGGPSWLPDQQGNGGLLSRAIGATPDQANRLQASLGAGFTAAANSAGKSPFQALAGGAGAAMEGASKEQHQNTKDAQGYLQQAIAAKKAGDDAAYKTNYMKYLQADLKASQEKAASKDAASKNDSPTQLYLSANRLVQADGDVRAASKSLMDARKTGTPDEQTKAQERLQQLIQQKQDEHYAALGLHPRTAAELSKQPGMSQSNPIDAGSAGITKDNIAKKLQPGQYYKNPTDGKVYLYKGPKGSDSKPSGKPKPADPMNPQRGTMPAAMAGADAEAE